jgi:hypothetical protein
MKRDFVFVVNSVIVTVGCSGGDCGAVMGNGMKWKRGKWKEES